MDQYKQSLCRDHFGDDCKNEEDIFRLVVENKYDYYTYNLNANGKLHSRYLAEFGCYEPAIIRKNRYTRDAYSIYLYWLFDGEIRDCLHPFVIRVYERINYINTIEYYSSKRIQQQQPIYSVYSGMATKDELYNKFRWGYKLIAIINDPSIPSYNTSGVPGLCDMTKFVTIAPDIICPRWSDTFTYQ